MQANVGVGPRHAVAKGQGFGGGCALSWLPELGFPKRHGDDQTDTTLKMQVNLAFSDDDALKAAGRLAHRQAACLGFR